MLEYSGLIVVTLRPLATSVVVIALDILLIAVPKTGSI
jgi:hypothetical protein